MPGSLTDIRLFVAVYEERSFTAAARRENATQSGVSQHIAKLERALHVRLFDRKGGSIVPTGPADILYAHFIEVLRAYAAAGQGLGEASGALTGEVAIGLMPTMTRSALAPALKRFADAYPGVAVRVVEAYSGVLTREVRAGALDFAVVPAFAGGPGLSVRHFLTTPETLVSSRTAKGSARALRHMAPVRLADLKPLKLIVPGTANTRRQTLDTYFASHGAGVARTMELDAMMGTLDMVAGSDWVTILPGVMMARDAGARSGQFKVNPLARPHLDLDLVAIEPARRALSPAAAAFYGELEAAARRINDVWPHLIPSPSPAIGRRGPL